MRAAFLFEVINLFCIEQSVVINYFERSILNSRNKKY